jgi:hypothetical protein
VLVTVAAVAAAVVAAVGHKSSADQERAGRQGSLRLAAKFAARLMASAIALRWRILEKESADPQRIEMLVAENATAGKKDPAAFKAIHNWLNEKIQEYDKTDHSASWFLIDRQGFIVALAGPGPWHIFKAPLSRRKRRLKAAQELLAPP